MKKKYYIIVAAIALSALSFTPKKARAQDEVEYSWWYYTHRYIPWTIHGNWLPIDSTYFLGTTDNYPLDIVVDSSTRFYLDTTGINYLYGLTYIDSLVLGGHVYTDSIASATGNGILLKVNDSSQINITDSGTVIVKKNLSVPNGYIYVDSIRCEVIHVGDSSITIGGKFNPGGSNTISSSATVAPLTLISGSTSQPLTLKSGNGNITLGNSPLIPFSKFYNVNVGIGTRTPQAQLHVYDAHFNIGAPPSPVAVYTLYTSGVDSNNANGFKTGIDASGNATLNQTQDLPMNFLTRDSARMTILANGNVGVGNYNAFTPARKLDVYDNSGNHPQMRLTQSDNVNFTDFLTDANGMLTISPTGGIISIAATTQIQQTTGQFGFLLGNPGMGLNSSDIKVGIGTTSPIWQLTILNSDNDPLSTCAQFLNKSCAGVGEFNGFFMGIESSADAIFQQNEDGKIIHFFTNNGTLTERMRIHSAGNVGIGDFTNGGGTHIPFVPADRLEVNDDSGNPQLRLSYSLNATPADAVFTDFQTTDLGDLYINPYNGTNNRRVGINTSTPGNTLEINSDTANKSGLRFTQLTWGSPTIANGGNKGVLAVDSVGDVIYVSGGSGKGNVSSCDSLVPGDLDFVTKWTSTDTANPQICKSQIYDNGTNVLINAGSTTVTSTTRLEADMNNTVDQTIGILGNSTNNATSGETYSYGIFGNCFASATSGTSHNYGTYGQAIRKGTNNYGIYGISDSATNINDGVFGTSTNGSQSQGGGFIGYNGTSYTSGAHADAYSTTSSINYGVFGASHGTGGGVNYGVYGQGDGVNSGINYGFYGLAENSSNINYGVYASGISSTANATYGIYATAAAATNSICYGTYTEANSESGNTNYGLYASASSGTTNYAAFIDGDGVYTGTWAPFSDIRLKQNINPLNNPLAVIKQLSPKSYEFKVNEYPRMHLAKGNHYGFIAQDMSKILPDLVSNGILPPKLDSSGNIISQADTFNTLNYIELIPFIVGAENQLDSVNQVLKKNVDSLQAQMARVNGTLQQLLNCCQSQNQGSNTPGGRGEGAGEDTLSVALSNSAIILDQNAPNPFAENTTITYFIPTTVQSAQIMFYDNTGLVLKSVAITTRGEGSLLVYASNLSSGIYTYALIADGQLIASKKMVCQK